METDNKSNKSEIQSKKERSVVKTILSVILFLFVCVIGRVFVRSLVDNMSSKTNDNNQSEILKDSDVKIKDKYPELVTLMKEECLRGELSSQVSADELEIICEKRKQAYGEVTVFETKLTLTSDSDWEAFYNKVDEETLKELGY